MQKLVLLISNREKIITDFAMWTALSSTRSNCPIKSRKDIYPLLKNRFEHILEKQEINSHEDFISWHKKNVYLIRKKVLKDKKIILPVIWAIKIINVYLKTSVYIGGIGNPKLINFIHPPIDTELLQGIKENFKEEFEKNIGKYNKMKDIKTYKDYNIVINFMKTLTNKKYPLIEIDKYWKGTEYSNIDL